MSIPCPLPPESCLVGVVHVCPRDGNPFCCWPPEVWRIWWRSLRYLFFVRPGTPTCSFIKMKEMNSLQRYPPSYGMIWYNQLHFTLVNAVVMFVRCVKYPSCLSFTKECFINNLWTLHLNTVVCCGYRKPARECWWEHWNPFSVKWLLQILPFVIEDEDFRAEMLLGCSVTYYNCVYSITLKPNINPSIFFGKAS